jgi:uncharacterized protein YceK
MRIVVAAVCAALPLLVTGCGSLYSRWNGTYGPYVGVKFDVDQVTHYQTEGEVIAAIDIPISAIADTLFLPYDLSRPEKKQADAASLAPTEAVAQSTNAAPNPALADDADRR